MLNNNFRNLNNESFTIIFYTASFAWPPILPLIKPCDITKEFQQNAIPLHDTFHGLKITNCFFLPLFFFFEVSM